MSSGSIQSVSISLIDGHAGGGLGGRVVSLEERAINSLSEAAVQAGVEKSNIISQLDQSNLSNPKALSMLQKQIHEYGNKIAFLGVVFRKTTGVAETLLRQ